MNHDDGIQLENLDERTREAIQELQRTMSEHYPSTTFEVVPALDVVDELSQLVVPSAHLHRQIDPYQAGVLRAFLREGAPVEVEARVARHRREA